MTPGLMFQRKSAQVAQPGVTRLPNPLQTSSRNVKTRWKERVSTHVMKGWLRLGKTVEKTGYRWNVWTLPKIGHEAKCRLFPFLESELGEL